MGLGGISIWNLLIVLAIVILIFGTKKFKNIGGDLGSAIKSFKSAMSDGEKEANTSQADAASADKKVTSASEPIETTSTRVEQEEERK